MDWYGPNDVWPQHGRDYFRAALNHARAAGWSFGKFSSHSFGKVVCDRTLPEDSRCEFLVFSSGAGAETKALELRSLVDRCNHRSTSSGTRMPAVDVADSLLNEADLLISAAQRCMNADSMRAQAEELLELAAIAALDAGQALSMDEKKLDRAAELESASHDERDAAVGLADVAGYPAGAPVEADPLLEAADDRVTTAEHRLGPPSNSGRRRGQLRDRVVRTRATIYGMQAQLGGEPQDGVGRAPV